MIDSVLLVIPAAKKDCDDELIMMVPVQSRKIRRPASLSWGGKALPSLRYWFCQFARYHLGLYRGLGFCK